MRMTHTIILTHKQKWRVNWCPKEAYPIGNRDLHLEATADITGKTIEYICYVGYETANGLYRQPSLFPVI